MDYYDEYAHGYSSNGLYQGGGQTERQTTLRLAYPDSDDVDYVERRMSGTGLLAGCGHGPLWKRGALNGALSFS